MSKIILTKEQEDLLEEALITNEVLNIYTEDLKKIGWFGNNVYQSRNKTNPDMKDFRRIFFKFSQPYNNNIKGR